MASTESKCDADLTRFPLRRLVLGGRELVLFALFTVGGLSIARREAAKLTWELSVLVVGIVLAAFCTVWLVRRLSTLGGKRPALEVYEDRLVVPRSALSNKTLSIPLREIEGLAPSTDPLGLWIKTLGVTIFLPDRIFATRGAGAQIFQEVLQRLERAAWVDVEKLRRSAVGGVQQQVAQSTPVTRVLVYSLVFTYLIQGVLLTESPLSYLALGANAPSLSLWAEPERLVVANLLHGNLVHIFFNAIALQSLGQVLERLVGGARVFVVFWLTAFAGATASAALGQGVFSLGASTGVFGLFGFFSALCFFWRHQLPGGTIPSKRWWQMVVIANVLLPVLIPVIDWVGHASGVLSGMALGWWVVPKGTHFPCRDTRLLRGFSGIIGAVLALAVGITALNYSSWDIGRELRFLRDQVGHMRAGGAAFMRNERAWHVATNPKSSEAELTVALELVELAEAEATERLELPDGFFETMAFFAEGGRVSRDEIEDTRATLQHRLGNSYSAAAVQQELLVRQIAHATDIEGLEFTATQLLRFLRGAERMGVVEHVGTEDRPWRFANEVGAKFTRTATTVSLRLTEDWSRAETWTAYLVLAGTDEGPAGLVQIPIVSSSSTAFELPLPEPASGGRWAASQQVSLAALFPGDAPPRAFRVVRAGLDLP